MSKRSLCRWIVIAALVGPSLAFAQYTSKPLSPETYADAPMKYTGIAFANEVPCSGAVVKDTRIMLSASHCIFQTDRTNPWQGSLEWFLRYASANIPVAGQGQPTRGYWYFTSYADAVRLYTMSSPESFDLDYMAAYAYAPLAEEAAPYFIDGHDAILGNPWKQTLGYPSSLYPGAHRYRYYMHANGPWTAQCETRYGSYILCNEVSTGPGNSGGPVFVWDPQSSRYGYAGVLVSGLERSRGDGYDLSGINAMSQDEWGLVTSAIESADKELPDDGKVDDGKVDEGKFDDGTPPSPENRQRLQVYGNGSLIWNKKRSISRGDMTDFGSVTSSKAITRTFTLKNDGTAPLLFSNKKPVYLDGPASRYFKLRSRLRRELEPQESQNLRISFSSRIRGLYRTRVVLKSDDPLAPSYLFTIQARRR